MHDAALGLLGDVEVVRASTASDGSQLPARASSPSLSADGTKVAFALIQIDPVTFNPTGVQQLYVKDLTTGQLSLVSSNAAGEASNSGASKPIISADGTKVFFISASTNLVANDTNGTGDIFVKDLTNGDATLVAPGAFGTILAVSNDGSLVAFGSKSNDLVPGDNNSTAVTDIFVKNLQTGQIQIVTTSADGNSASSSSIAPFFSPDGTKVGFISIAGNLVPGVSGFQVYLKDLQTGSLSVVSASSSGEASSGGVINSAGFSPDGTRIIFDSDSSNLVAGDTNGAPDVFIKNLSTGELSRVSPESDGSEGSGAGGGIFAGNDHIIFSGDTIYVKDLLTGHVTPLVANLIGEEGDSNPIATAYAASLDGSHAAFVTASANFVFGDTSGEPDVYVTNRGLEPGVLLGTTAAETIMGTSADEVFVGYFGADNIVGGGGNDTISFINDDAPVFVNLTLGQGFTNTSAGDTYSGIANVIGSSAADFIIGSTAPNKLDGREGNDVLLGGPGADTLNGGAGIDTASYAGDIGAVFVNLTLGQGYGNAAQGDVFVSIENLIGTDYNDFLIGDPGVNRLEGGAGDDRLIGSLGGDVLIGGAGGDWASYEDNQGSVFVNLTLQRGYNNAAEGDTYEGIENVAGGLFDDFLLGDDGANRLEGAMGADTYYGFGGADVFVFTYAPGALSPFDHPYIHPNVDTIMDFATGVDKIELSATAFPGLAAGALPAAAFYAGSAAHDGDDRIVYDAASGQLWFDPDGNGAQAAMLFATLGETSHPTAIAASDFVVV